MLQKYLECGQIVRAHGINGAMVVNHFCDSSEIFESLKFVYLKEGNEYKKTKVLRAVPYKSGVLVTLEGITTPEQVVTLRMKYLYADRDDIPLEEGAHFIADLLGLPVLDDASGEKLGEVEDVICPAGQDIYVVKKADGGTFMIPAVAAFIRAVSPENGYIRVSLIEGMMD